MKSINQFQRRSIAFTASIVAVVIALSVFQVGQSKPLRDTDRGGDLDDRAFLKLIQDRDRFVKVTELRYEMEEDVSSLCSFTVNETPYQPRVHDTKYCDVYVTKEQEQILRKRGRDYPVGTVLIKQKFPKVDAKEPELATIMRKRETGYWPQNGDWEYAVISGDQSVVVGRGRIDSCAECHAQYEKTGFVTGVYLSHPFAKDDWKLGK
jgi:hypothetical protein